MLEIVNHHTRLRYWSLVSPFLMPIADERNSINYITYSSLVPQLLYFSWPDQVHWSDSFYMAGVCVMKKH